VDAKIREAVSASALLAQLHANKQVHFADNPQAWFSTYTEVLQNVGWALKDQGWDEATASGTQVEVNEKIIGLLTVALGAAPAALAIVTAAVTALKDMNPDSPWITLFSREAQVANKLNCLTINDAAEVRALFSELIGQKVDESFLLVPPFYTAHGDEIRVGRNVFVNQNWRKSSAGHSLDWRRLRNLRQVDTWIASLATTLLLRRIRIAIELGEQLLQRTRTISAKPLAQLMEKIDVQGLRRNLKCTSGVRKILGRTGEDLHGNKVLEGHESQGSTVMRHLDSSGERRRIESTDTHQQVDAILEFVVQGQHRADWIIHVSTAQFGLEAGSLEPGF
jgi:hypothetical protein